MLITVGFYMVGCLKSEQKTLGGSRNRKGVTDKTCANLGVCADLHCSVA